MSTQDAIDALVAVLQRKGYRPERVKDEIRISLRNRDLGYDDNHYGDRLEMEQAMDAWYRKEQQGIRFLAGSAFAVEVVSSYEYGTLDITIQAA